MSGGGGINRKRTRRKINISAVEKLAFISVDLRLNSACNMSKIVGIDLGTTNSLVATVDSGIPLVIADAERPAAHAVGRAFSVGEFGADCRP